jgi:hypothetical protein
MIEATLFLEVLWVDPRAWLREALGKSFEIRETLFRPQSNPGGDASRRRPLLTPSRSRDMFRVESPALARLAYFDKATGKPDATARWRKRLWARRNQETNSWK